MHTENWRNKQIANLFLQNTNRFPPHTLVFVVCVCDRLSEYPKSLCRKGCSCCTKGSLSVLSRRDTLWSDLSWDGWIVMIQCSIPSLKRMTEKLVFNVSGLFDVYESRYLHKGRSEEGERKQFTTEGQESGPNVMIYLSTRPKSQRCSDFYPAASMESYHILMAVWRWESKVNFRYNLKVGLTTT